jgi:drug/metabolite transporter (DMT)-like permease
MTRRSATLVGFAAVLMWALFAFLTAASGVVPPFQLLAMSFLIGGSLGAVTWPFRPGAMQALKQGWRVWAIGVGGLFGFHSVFFSAIRIAPAVEVSLIAYLWPLFLVVFSALLPGEKIKLHHVIGVVLGLLGAMLVITKGQSLAITQNFSSGHVLAFACSLIWAAYSVLSRRIQKVSTDCVAGFCLVTSVLAVGVHLIFETTVWPQDMMQWLAVLGLGLLPVGLAFYAWDYGVKHGDIMVLGAASYAAPLLSTLVLVVVGQADFAWSVVVACLMITAGAVIAAKDMLSRKST